MVRRPPPLPARRRARRRARPGGRGAAHPPPDGTTSCFSGKAFLLGEETVALSLANSTDKHNGRAKTDRAAELTRRLLAVYRHQFSDPELLDLDQLVGELVVLLRSMVGEDVALRVVPAGEPLPVMADQAQLGQGTDALADVEVVRKPFTPGVLIERVGERVRSGRDGHGS